MPRPRFVLDVRTKEPLAICCDEESPEDSQEKVRDGEGHNCIKLAPTHSSSRGPFPHLEQLRGLVDIEHEPGIIILSYHFAGFTALREHVNNLQTELPELTKERDGILVLTLTGVDHLNLKQLAPLRRITDARGYSVYLTVYDE
jgi:hypothetical protein